MVKVPAEVAQAVPTLIVKTAVPLLATMLGEVQNVVAIGAVELTKRFVTVRDVNLPVDAVVDPIAPGAANVDPPKVNALELKKSGDQVPGVPAVVFIQPNVEPATGDAE